MGQEFAHGLDLGVVAAEAQFGQVPGVFDGAQQRAMAVRHGTVLTKCRGPLGPVTMAGTSPPPYDAVKPASPGNAGPAIYSRHQSAHSLSLGEGWPSSPAGWY
jgi:hypothetical protein